MSPPVASRKLNLSEKDSNTVTSVVVQEGLEYAYSGTVPGTGDVVIKLPRVNAQPGVAYSKVYVDAFGRVIGGEVLDASKYIENQNLVTQNATFNVLAGTLTTLVVSQDAMFVNGVTLVSAVAPAAVENKLYNVGGTLYWNGGAVGGAIPTASATVLGGVKVGSGLQISGAGVLSVANITANLDDLLDVTIDTPAVGEVLTYSGGNWVNSALPYASGSTYGTVKIGTGLSVDGTGALTTSSTPLFDYVDFNQSVTPTYQTGRLFFDNVDVTLAFCLTNGSILQIGQELVLRALNNTGSTINNGQVVYISGAQGNRPTIALAEADVAAHSRVIAVATQAVGNNQVGYFTIHGIVRDLDTSAFSEGAEVWLSITAGAITSVKPSAPNAAVSIGTVIRSHATQGQILVIVERGVSMTTVSDVNISNPVNGQVLTYQSGVWVNATPSGGTPVNMVTTDTTQTITGAKVFTSATTMSRLTIDSDQPTNVAVLRGRPSSGSTNANVLLDLYSSWNGTSYSGPALYFGRSNGNGWFTSTPGSFFFSGHGGSGSAENMYFGAATTGSVSASQCSLVIEVDTHKVFLGGLLTSASTRLAQIQGGAYIKDTGIEIASDVPSSTVNTLYNSAGTLYWNGSAVGAPSNYVTTDTTQTITGAKTFGSLFTVDNRSVFTTTMSVHGSVNTILVTANHDQSSGAAWALTAATRFKSGAGAASDAKGHTSFTTFQDSVSVASSGLNKARGFYAVAGQNDSSNSACGTYYGYSTLTGSGSGVTTFTEYASFAVDDETYVNAAFTNRYGLLVKTGNVTPAAGWYGIYIQDGPASPARYSIYTGNAPSRFGGSVELPSFTPSSTTNRLYNVSSALFWNGSQLSTKLSVTDLTPSSNTSLTALWVNRHTRVAPSASINLVVEQGIAAVGDKISILQANTTFFVLTAASGVTLRCATSQLNIQARAQWSAIELICVATNTFDVVGDFTP